MLWKHIVDLKKLRKHTANLSLTPAVPHLNHRLVQQGPPVGCVDGQHVVVTEGAIEE